MIGDAALTTALVTIIIALTKVIEHFIGKHRDKGEKKASLHPEIVRQLRETYESTAAIEKGINAIIIDNDRHLEIIRQIAVCMQTVSESQAKTADLLSRIDRRMEIEEALRRAKGSE